MDQVNDFVNFGFSVGMSAAIEEAYGKKYLPNNPINYSGKKAKNAQEAHEAIRPTEIERNPESLKKYLSTNKNLTKKYILY